MHVYREVHCHSVCIQSQFSSPVWILGVEFSSSHLGAGALVHWALYLVFLTQFVTESGAHLFSKT